MKSKRKPAYKALARRVVQRFKEAFDIKGEPNGFSGPRHA